MIQTAIWVPPSLCGCQLKMTADFTEGSVIDGISYRHPKPFTITALAIVDVCAQHKPQTLSMLDTSGLFDIDPHTGALVQRRGYLAYPIANPTVAECLYTFLSQYGGQIHGYSCGCRAHQFVDENKNIVYLKHPRHAKVCHKHKGDTVDMQKAKLEHDDSLMNADKSALG